MLMYFLKALFAQEKRSRKPTKAESVVGWILVLIILKWLVSP